MYRPSKYKSHNESLRRFMEIFNPIGQKYKIRMFTSDVENFSDDGIIMLDEEDSIIIFDWEKRQDKTAFYGGQLKFNTLGQFGRKFYKKPKIGITIQSDIDEKYFIVALHTTFKNKTNVNRKTDTKNKEYGEMRTSSEYIIYSFDSAGVEQFIKQLILWKNAPDYYDIVERLNGN